MPRRKRPRSQTTEIITYIVQITGWDWSYSFGLNGLLHSDAHYSDHRHLQVLGTLLLPTRIKEKDASLAFLPHIEAEEIEGRPGVAPPRAVGSLTIHNGEIEGNLGMPRDALSPILQMLIAEHFRYVVMNGERMRWRNALIRGYRFETEVNVEDYLDE